MGKYISRITKSIKSAGARKFKKVIANIYKLFPFYYTKLNKISLANWFLVTEGQFKYLNKYGFNYVPLFFGIVYQEMIYQMDKLDLTLLKKRADAAILAAQAAKSGNMGIKFQSDALKKEIKDIQDQNKDNKRITLNEFVNVIEISLNCIGQIDPEKISASRGYSLFNTAQSKIKANKKRNGINN